MPRLSPQQDRPVRFHTVLFSVVILLLVGVFFIGATPALAQTTFEQFGEASTLSDENIAILIARIIRIALSVVGIILVSLIIYAGYLWFTAAGRPEPAAKAKKVLQQAVIGLIIIFSAYAITSFILNSLLDAAFGGDTTSVTDNYSEPLSGSLGAGILEDHYPERNATDIARNTKIFVTFKEEINPASIISGYDPADDSITDLNTDSILIYPTGEGEAAALGATDVRVSYNEDFEIFVFDPVEYLGSAEEDTNYTVQLTTNIETAAGESAFSGRYSGGYEWTFEVSTEIDLTPPTVIFTIPQQDDEEPRNVSIELSFSEAMDPVAATGTYSTTLDSFFDNINVLDTSGDNVEGVFEISNGYKTVTFTTFDACGEDPCGDPIYCLPGNETLAVQAKAASVNADDPPQSLFAIADGLTDAAANSLDGDDDGEACGSDSDSVCTDGGVDADDDYTWTFTTTNELEDTVPEIHSLDPEVLEDEINQSEPVAVTFNTTLKSSTLSTSSVSLWPDPYYEFWFTVRKADTVTESTPSGCDLTSVDGSCVSLNHPTLVANADGGWDYYPVLTSDIKSSYQICMYPAMDGQSCDGSSSNTPYCCNGSPSLSACDTDTQDTLGDDETLPGNSETEGFTES